MKPKYLALVGGIAMIAGSVLPWTFTTLTFAPVVYGMVGYGRISLVCGVIVVIATLIAKDKTRARANIVAVIAGIAGGLFAFLSLLDIVGAMFGIEFPCCMQASIGIGIYLVIIGAVLAIVGGLMKNSHAVLQSTTTPS